jgi:uncharacterized protein YjbI with pentapeptide repeats
MRQKLSIEELTDRYSVGERNFSKIDLSNLRFVDCNFKNANFENVDFTGSWFEKCNFDNASFVRASLNKANLDTTNFRECSMMYVNALGCRIQFCDFSNSNLQYCKFMSSWISENDFEKADLANADFSFVCALDDVLYTKGKCINTVMPNLKIRDDISSETINVKNFTSTIKFRDVDFDETEIVRKCKDNYNLFVKDEDMCKHLLEDNYVSLGEVISTLLHCHELELWDVSNKNLERLQQLNKKIKSRANS